MKVRISGNSLRFRISRSDLASLQADARVETTLHFGPGPGASFTYALERSASAMTVSTRCVPGGVTVLLPAAQANEWNATDQVGIYESIDVGSAGRLDLILEKDFACLDGTDAQNADTFPNPAADAGC
jgi:hypothetical protein